MATGLAGCDNCLYSYLSEEQHAAKEQQLSWEMMPSCRVWCRRGASWPADQPTNCTRGYGDSWLSLRVGTFCEGEMRSSRLELVQRLTEIECLDWHLSRRTEQRFEEMNERTGKACVEKPKSGKLEGSCYRPSSRRSTTCNREGLPRHFQAFPGPRWDIRYATSDSTEYGVRISIGTSCLLGIHIHRCRRRCDFLLLHRSHAHASPTPSVCLSVCVPVCL